MKALRDPLELGLDGIRVVEASAGTGKTFAIATLYLRLILERDLQPEEIVVATFTRAAAAELSERLRRRLVIADEVLGSENPVTPQPDDNPEQTVCRRVIAAALDADLDQAMLRRRALRARLAIDTAMIGTLHGFCFRALDEFGFETGQALRQPELIEDVRARELEIVRDFWRRGSADAGIAQPLAETWGSPQRLADQVCDARWRGRDVEIPVLDVSDMEVELDRMRRQINAWDDATLAGADQEIGASFSNASARQVRCKALRALRGWARGDLANRDPDAFAMAEAARFEPGAMQRLASFRRLPDGELFDAVVDLHALLAELLPARVASEGLPAAELLRDARAYLETERRRRLAARNLMSHDQAVDRLAAALADPGRGDAAVQRMRGRWKAALIDEFQDTDATQWDVMRRLFAGTTLVLVGDPKQAIYSFRGGDAFAWRQAVNASDHARLELATSFRSGTGMTGAINALFGRPDAFDQGGAGIDYTDVSADTSAEQRAVLRDGKPAAALQLWRFTPEDVGQTDGKEASKGRARSGLQSACVAWIVDAVTPESRVQLRNGAGELTSLQPQHIAVLVNSNAEAHAMQAALARAGVPASSNLRASVFTSDEASDLALLIEALAAPDDARRARAAHASVLLGLDAAAIADGIGDNAGGSDLLTRVAGWADAVGQHGPLPLLHRLIAAAGPRLLALPDGERRVANYQQLAELLQDLYAQCFGLEDLAVRFARACIGADDDADSARQRLDTDADSVTVSTVHMAKGLEYDVVLVPYAVLARDPNRRGGGQPPVYWYHGDDGAPRVAIGVGTGINARQRAVGEIQAEEVRKLYVAVTRAKALCVLPWGAVNMMENAAAYHLLHQAGREEPLAADRAGCDQALRELCQRAEGAAEVVPLPQACAPHRHTTRTAHQRPLTAREFSRRGLERDWQTWSFSRLVRGQAKAVDSDPAPGAGDAAALSDAASPARPTLAGARFGSAVHAALEHADYVAWKGASDVPESQRELLARCLRAQGLPEDDMSMGEALRQTGACVGAAMNVELPCGVRACELAADARRAEMEFHLALAPASADKFFALLHRHGYQQQRSGVGTETLHGLLTGVIDLVFRHAGQYHLIDWKTNWCPPYDDAAVRAEIASHDYDLQWLIYTLALHRWLKKCSADYDYDRDLGPGYYVFVRGLADGHGIHADRPARELIEAMDALFDARVEAAA